MKTSERIRSISIDHKTSSIDPVARMRSPVFVLNDAAQIATEADALMADMADALEALNPHNTGAGMSMDWQAYHEAQNKAQTAIKHYQEYLK